MTAIPTKIRDAMRDKLWEQCDDLGWMALQDVERARYYEQWTRDKAIGGQLAQVMDARKVRVYIKDSLVKPYVRARLSLNESEVWRLLDLTETDRSLQTFIKPHGRRLEDGRIVGWGRSRDWKSVLMAVFERSRAARSYSAFGIVLLESGKTESEKSRSLVREAASLLGVDKLAWLE
ncbi:hypothetical protein [Sphingomonas sp. R86520]|uniref:hypothetical protein n=1 Tax=Sphingomonas sp. R86520 TaxID=3093859 RepID=UPI0036D2E8A7